MPLDLTGKRFGQLVVLSGRKHEKWNYWKWTCRCDCGQETTAYCQQLRRHLKTICHHCMSAKRSKDRTIHGLSKTKEYSIWATARARTGNPNDRAWRWYGGRGIVMCDEWRNSFQAFINDMGFKPTPKHTIERIDNDGPYAPDNCRWATPKEQAQNRRRTWRHKRLITAFGRTKSITEWAREYGVRAPMIQKRLDHKHWSPEKAISTPSQKYSFR